ncbi:MAG: 30S ribosomal protein S9 [Candidatus Ancaeobacter aquaticus]|nr:30S ribosomal protein S9 [Candidatus Ancaeobacter aquaticus]
MSSEVVFYATGRRKTAIAKVRIFNGKGQMLVNNKSFDEYFKREILKMIALQPLELTECMGKYDISASVVGGGLAGQAGALRHGLTRALVKADDSLKAVLKKAGLLTRDPRKRERKKYGQKGARKRFQYSKR